MLQALTILYFITLSDQVLDPQNWLPQSPLKPLPILVILAQKDHSWWCFDCQFNWLAQQ